MIEALGDRAIRFARPPGVSARTIVREAMKWPGAIDVVVGKEHVGVYFDRTPTSDDTLISELPHARREEVMSRLVELPAIYDGPDLDDVTRVTGVDVAEVHAAGEYVVDMMGFLPGF